MLDLPLSGEDPLEEGMATDSSILAWRIPWTEETVHGESHGQRRLYMENPMYRSCTWQCTTHKVAKSQTQTKQLSIHTHIQ